MLTSHWFSPPVAPVACFLHSFERTHPFGSVARGYRRGQPTAMASIFRSGVVQARNAFIRARVAGVSARCTPLFSPLPFFSAQSECLGGGWMDGGSLLGRGALRGNRCICWAPAGASYACAYCSRCSWSASSCTHVVCVARGRSVQGRMTVHLGFVFTGKQSEMVLVVVVVARGTGVREWGEGCNRGKERRITPWRLFFLLSTSSTPCSRSRRDAAARTSWRRGRGSPNNDATTQRGKRSVKKNVQNR
jgi:hypothetical protein